MRKSSNEMAAPSQEAQGRRRQQCAVLRYEMLLDGRGLLRAIAHVAPGPLPAGSPRRRVREGGSSNDLLDARALSSTAPARLIWYVALGPGNYRRGSTQQGKRKAVHIV